MTLKATIKHLVKDADKPIKAFADVVIDDSVVIHGIGVVENEKGRHISMPHSMWTNKDGEKINRDIAHPISSSARNLMQTAVFEAYDNAVNANGDNIAKKNN